MTKYSVYLQGKNEKEFILEASDDLVVLKTRSRAALNPFDMAVGGALQAAHLIAHDAHSGLQAFRFDPIVMSLANRLDALRLLADVEYADGGLVTAESRKTAIHTGTLFIKFRDDTDEAICQSIISDAGLVIDKKIGYASNAYYLRAASPLDLGIFALAQSLFVRDEVETCYPELMFEATPLGAHPNQWHLKKTNVSYPVEVDASANVIAAHDVTRGKNITIAVIDGGFDLEHPALKGPGKVVFPFDAEHDTDNPRPKSADENHGTPCAGIACANDTSQAMGVAPDAKLMPIRIVLDGHVSFKQMGNAIRWAATKGADVISCSWGFPAQSTERIHDPMSTGEFLLPEELRLAIDYAVNKGRDGKGCVILFAAGNSNESIDRQGLPSYSKVITVAACNDRGERSAYSSYGKGVWCCFPSNDIPAEEPLTKGIWTTDRREGLGYNKGSAHSRSGYQTGEYTTDFGGTSASCPGAAGVAALVLSCYPNLKWYEVKDLLKDSCDKIDSARGQYDKTTGHSIFYGHGRLNAARAVERAVEMKRDYDELYA